MNKEEYFKEELNYIVDQDIKESLITMINIIPVLIYLSSLG